MNIVTYEYSYIFSIDPSYNFSFFFSMYLIFSLHKYYYLCINYIFVIMLLYYSSRSSFKEWV